VIILIEAGDVFEGTAEMLDDCFGIGVDELDSFCAFHNWKFKILDSEQ
jgi:hypothetical protein